MYVYIYIYIYINYVIKKTDNVHINYVLSCVLPICQWPDVNSCTWAHGNIMHKINHTLLAQVHEIGNGPENILFVFSNTISVLINSQQITKYGILANNVKF